MVERSDYGFLWAERLSWCNKSGLKLKKKKDDVLENGMFATEHIGKFQLLVMQPLTMREWLR